MTTAHTATPWVLMEKPKASTQDHGWRAMAMCGSFMVAAHRDVAIKVKNGIVTSAWDNKTNAEFIVRACNEHDALVKALRQCVDALVEHGDLSWYVAEAKSALGKEGAA